MLITEASCYAGTGSHPYTSPYLQGPHVTAEPNRLVSIGEVTQTSPPDCRRRLSQYRRRPQSVAEIFVSLRPPRFRRTTEVDYGASLAALTAFHRAVAQTDGNPQADRGTLSSNPAQ